MKVAELFEKGDGGSVGVNLTPAAKKAKKRAEAAFKMARRHIKTSGYNQAYAKKHPKEVNEAFVIKNKDGKEKRFKDSTSIEARAWKDSSPAKAAAKIEKYTKAWWQDKEYDMNFDGLLPWAKITNDEIGDQFDRISTEQGLGRIEDWTASSRGYIKIDDIDQVAKVNVRLSFSFGKEDDMGLDIKGDERVSDSQSITLRRDTKNPKKLVFAGYQ